MLPRLRTRLLPLLAVLLATAAPAVAGTLCGTVRDGLTSQPVARAGIFLRTPAGAYTGLYGASDAAGAFCIGNVPAGTYDLEVRVDDYQVAFRRGVVVTDDLTGVEIPTHGLEVALLPPSPNPARGSVLFRYRLREARPVDLVIVDGQGRFVRGWGGEAAAGEFRQTWDFLDHRGRPVPAGQYYIRLGAKNVVLVRSFVRLR